MHIFSAKIIALYIHTFSCSREALYRPRTQFPPHLNSSAAMGDDSRSLQCTSPAMRALTRPISQLGLKVQTFKPQKRDFFGKIAALFGSGAGSEKERPGDAARDMADAVRELSKGRSTDTVDVPGAGVARQSAATLNSWDQAQLSALSVEQLEQLHALVDQVPTLRSPLIATAMLKTETPDALARRIVDFAAACLPDTAAAPFSSDKGVFFAMRHCL